MHERLTAINQEIQDFIGDGAIFEHGMIVFSYLKPNGDSRTGYIAINKPNIQQTLGMMELSKSHILHRLGDLSDDDPQT